MASVELVTILISDLVGSTGLESRVGPAVADELRHEHFGVLRKAIEGADGKEVKNTGDGLMVAFVSASAAVGCAVTMQQLMQRRNRNADQQLHVRIGIGAGEATVEDGDYFGMPAIEAARLCDRASSDGILTSATAQILAGRRGGLVFESVGGLELKGIPDRVEAFSVTWEPLGTEAGAGVPLPPALGSVPGLSYVGRVQERAGLEAWSQEARERRRRVVMLAGEPGIGKTRLAAHTALEAHAAGFAVLWGAATEDLGAPYGAWIQALSHYVEHAPEEVLGAHVERHGGELSRLVRALTRRVSGAPAPQDSDPETERYLLFGAVAGLLEAACEHSAVALVLDDLHWADKETLSLLKHVADAAAHLPLLVIVTYRDSDLDHGHPLTGVLADLRRLEGVERLALTGLGADEVAALMGAVAGHDLDAAGLKLAGEITTETGGNPFFVAEILRHLSESGAIVQDADGRWRPEGSIAELGLPQSVHEVIGRRVERLGEPAQQLLTVAAVVGRAFDVELLVGVVGGGEDALFDVLEQAVEASVLVESSERLGRFSFAHALINHTLYEGLSANRRARMHRRVAEALEDLCGEDPGERLSELAYHWGRATVSDNPAKAISYARRAGERALAALAPDEALRWFGQASELLEGGGSTVDERVRCDVMVGLGEAQRLVGDPAFRQTLLAATEIAQRLADADRLVQALLANSSGATSAVGEVDRERVSALESAMALGVALPHRARLLALLANELAYAGDFARVRALSDEAVSLARSGGDPRELAHVLSFVTNAIRAARMPDTLEERWALSAELLALSEELADPQLQFMANNWRFNAAMQRGDLEEMKRALERQCQLAEEIGLPFMRWISLFGSSTFAQLAGNLEQAEALALQAAAVGHETGFNPMKAGDDGQTGILLVVGAQLVNVRREQDRLDEMVDIIAERAQENPGLPALQVALAWAYTELDRLDEAATIIDQAASEGFAGLPFDVGWLTGMAGYAAIAASTEHAPAATTLYARLLPYRSQMVTNPYVFLGSVEHFLGLLAATINRDEAAEEHFAAAAEVHQRLGAQLLLARTWMNWGHALLRRGREKDTPRANELLDQALDLARKHDGTAIVRETEALIAEHQPA